MFGAVYDSAVAARSHPGHGFWTSCLLLPADPYELVDLGGELDELVSSIWLREFADRKPRAVRVAAVPLAAAGPVGTSIGSRSRTGARSGPEVLTRGASQFEERITDRSSWRRWVGLSPFQVKRGCSRALKAAAPMLGSLLLSSSDDHLW